MNDHDYIMEAIISGDVAALGEIAQIFDEFPKGKDRWMTQPWITQLWIMHAVDCGTVEVVAWMLERGAPVSPEDGECDTVLHRAIERNLPNKYEIIWMLITAGADLNARGTNDWTPAHLAAVRNDVESLEILKDAGADFSIRTRIDGYANPLEEARDVGRSPDAVSYLEKITEQDVPPNA